MEKSFKLDKVIVILGPTCTGKTSLALKLCQLFNGVIISADSRQVVRYMDIGTGKIPAGETNRQVEKRDDRWTVGGVDIFGYDLIDPNEYFSAFDFKNYCTKIFPREHKGGVKYSLNGKNIFLVGGTGFYIDAVTGRVLLECIGPDMDLRRALGNLSTVELGEKLLELDESAYKTIDTKNPARLVRAIEKATWSHQVPQQLEERAVRSGTRDENAVEPVQGGTMGVFIGLTAEREVLYGCTDRWVDSIFNEKLFEEVKLIQARFPESHRLDGLVYKSAVDYLTGVMTLDEAKQRAKFDLHAYIRRQQTWFKGNPQIKWFDISQKNFDASIVSIVESSVNGESRLNG